jgi:hypothetical protein
MPDQNRSLCTCKLGRWVQVLPKRLVFCARLAFVPPAPRTHHKLPVFHIPPVREATMANRPSHQTQSVRPSFSIKTRSIGPSFSIKTRSMGPSSDPKTRGFCADSHSSRCDSRWRGKKQHTCPPKELRQGFMTSALPCRLCTRRIPATCYGKCVPFGTPKNGTARPYKPMKMVQEAEHTKTPPSCS